MQPNRRKMFVPVECLVEVDNEEEGSVRVVVTEQVTRIGTKFYLKDVSTIDEIARRVSKVYLKTYEDLHEELMG